jgi:ammonia channel protein AmtB
MWQANNHDDILDAFGVHGVGRGVGTTLLGVFAAEACNPGGADGFISGQASFLGKQLFAVGATESAVKGSRVAAS